MFLLHPIVFAVYNLFMGNSRKKTKQKSNRNPKQEHESTLYVSLSLWKCPRSSETIKTLLIRMRASMCNTVQWTPATQYKQQMNFADFLCGPFADVLG